MSNIFKEQMGTPEVMNAASKVGQASKVHGTNLENWLQNDILGIIRGFKGYSLYNPNKTTLIPYQQKKFFDVNGGSITSDAVCFCNPEDIPAFVVESKGTLNENMYGIAYFAQKYTERNIPYVLVTKDTKSILKSGESKYLKFLQGLDIKIFINNHQNYDDVNEIVHFWEDYNFSEMVRPYSEFQHYISNLVAKHKSTHSNHQFFNFEEAK